MYTERMIRDVKAWEAWERDYIRNTPVDAAENFRIFEAMLEHARAMGAFPPADPLEGIEHKIQLARALNSVGSPRSSRS